MSSSKARERAALSYILSHGMRQDVATLLIAQESGSPYHPALTSLDHHRFIDTMITAFSFTNK
jgi:hypothetical protein